MSTIFVKASHRAKAHVRRKRKGSALRTAIRGVTAWNNASTTKGRRRATKLIRKADAVLKRKMAMGNKLLKRNRPLHAISLRGRATNKLGRPKFEV